MIESKTIGQTLIRFVSQQGSSDRRHLIVIFSGFRKMGTYDFSGSPLKNIAARVIWIDDNFGGNYSYYMTAFNGRDISVDINKFIELELDEMGLSVTDCTLAGFSKGGSAALYYMARFGYRNCLAAVPQFAIGSYVENYWPKHLNSMSTRESDDQVEYLDSLLPKQIDSDLNRNKNIYLFSSPADNQYSSEILPNLSRMRAYENFNFVLTDTPLVQEHNEVTRYNIPAIVSILTLLAEGIAPQFGDVNNGSARSTISPKDLSGQPVAVLDRFSVIDNRLSLEGHVVMPGTAADSLSSVRVSLEFTSDNMVYRFSTSAQKNTLLNSKYYCSHFVDYSCGAFSRAGNEGIPLDSFAPGKYSISVTALYDSGVEISSQIATLNFSGSKNLVTDTGIYLLNTVGNALQLTVLSFDETAYDNHFFEVEKFNYSQGKIDTRGYFVPRNRTLDRWNSISYYLIAESESGQFTSLPLATGNRQDANLKSGNLQLDQSKGFFSTMRYLPQDFALSEFGTYSFRILAIFDGQIQIRKLPDAHNVNLVSPLNRLARVGVIGSCVSRDMFNSRLNKRWKGSYEFVGSFYQMSLISLMSNPLDINSFDLNDLEHHAYLATKEDFSKNFLLEIAINKPDVLLVDLRIDSRFGVLEIGSGSWITDNKWKIGQAKNYSHFSLSKRVALATNEKEYLELFRLAASKFAHFLEANLPETKIILNQPIAVSAYSGASDYGKLNARMNSQHNKHWDSLNEVFREFVPCSELNPPMNGILSDSRHPWGKGPVHYEPRYYTAVHDLLFAEIYNS